MVFFFFFVLSTIACVLFTLLWYQSRPKNIPPGPRVIPIFGYLPFILNKEKAPYFNELSKKYGPIFSFYMKDRLAVVLGDYPSIKKALIDQGDAFSGRPSYLFTSSSDLGAKNLLGSDGEHWKEHRRFALSTLRNFGIGKSSLEPIILDEISCFVEELEKKKGSNFDIAELLSISVCNNICLLEFAKRYEYDDEIFIGLRRALDFNLKHGSSLADQFFPILRSIPGANKILMFKGRKANANKLNDYMRDQIKAHKKTYKENESNDYINAYFTERNQRKSTNNNSELFDDETLVANLQILYAAGMETSTTTLRWGLLYLILHPDIQKRVHKEIDDVIGRNRMPSSEDRTRMPYTEATLLEIQRMGTVIPLSVMHRTTTDVQLEGYLIPKDTIIFPNLWAVHNDEKLFPDPKTFRPERFLNENGQLKKHDHVIPFSLGKRFCLGEPLARMEIFLYFTAMLQRFTFKKPDGAVLTTHSRISTINPPFPYELVITPRE